MRGGRGGEECGPELARVAYVRILHSQRERERRLAILRLVDGALALAL